MRGLPAVIAVATALCVTRGAGAAPQADVGVTAAGCGRVHPARSDFGFCLGGRGDLWLLRTRDTDWGVGPYTEFWTSRFDDLHIGGGFGVLAPLWPVAPIALSFGPAFDVTRSVTEGSATLFWGLASYNFHSPYAMENGVFLSVTRDLTSPPATRLVAGVRFDALWLALPFIVAYEAARTD